MTGVLSWLVVSLDFDSLLLERKVLGLEDILSRLAELTVLVSCSSFSSDSFDFLLFSNEYVDVDLCIMLIGLGSLESLDSFPDKLSDELVVVADGMKSRSSESKSDSKSSDEDGGCLEVLGDTDCFLLAEIDLWRLGADLDRDFLARADNDLDLERCFILGSG